MKRQTKKRIFIYAMAALAGVSIGYHITKPTRGTIAVSTQGTTSAQIPQTEIARSVIPDPFTLLRNTTPTYAELEREWAGMSGPEQLYFFQRLAEADPESAIRIAAQQHLYPRWQFESYAIREWAKRDLAAAIEWIEKREANNRETYNSKVSILEVIATDDFSLAWDYWKSSFSEYDKKRALEKLIRIAWKGNEYDVLKKASSQLSGQELQAALQPMVNALSEEDPLLALQLYDSGVDFTFPDSDSLMKSLTLQYPEKAIELSLKDTIRYSFPVVYRNLPEEKRKALYETVTNSDLGAVNNANIIINIIMDDLQTDPSKAATQLEEFYNAVNGNVNESIMHHALESILSSKENIQEFNSAITNPALKIELKQN